MSGPKAYTMKEMKGIVEYLVQHKAYSEIKGRKMWMNYSNSSTTTRTWQSLKETFLKRILPDIQNPYYQLTRDQVCSFREGVDVAAKERKNRLEIQPVSEESISHAENQKDIEQPSTSAELRNEVEKTSGEDIKSEKIAARNRSSADTFILEGNDSGNSGDDPEISKKTTEEPLAGFEEPVTKSLKECLDFEYSEPPSVVRDVLHDFETESESSDKEPQMEIVEVLDSNNTDANKNSADQDIIVHEDSDNVFTEKETIIVEGGKEVEIGPTIDHEIIADNSSNDLAGIKNWLKDCVQEEVVTQTENVVEEANVGDHIGDVSRNVSHEETEPMVIDDSVKIVETPNNNENKKSLDNENNDHNSLSTTADTIIPNNQEGNNPEVTKSLKTNGISDKTIPPNDVTTRKRSTSQDNTAIKKRKLDNGIEKSIASPLSSNNTEALFEDLNKSNDEDAVILSTIQDAQDVDESPQNKNPCLKSVSLFEEQFNTTKYTDSEDDTPIPKNVENQSEKITSVLEKTQATVKGVTQRDQEQEVTVKNLQGDKNQEESVKDVQVEKKTVEVVQNYEKNQEENVKAVLQGDRKPKKAVKDIQDQTKQKKSDEDAPKGVTMQNKTGDQKQDVSVEESLKVDQKQDVTIKGTPLADQKQGLAINYLHQDDQEQEVVQLDPEVEKQDKAATVEPLTRINKDVIVLKSNSDSDDEQMPLSKKPKERCKHLAQAFGFIPGTSMTATHRRKVLRSRNKAKPRLQSYTINESSGWEGSFSDTEITEEYVSPPRSHRHKHGNRLYKKPEAGRMANDEEGRLFFVFGKKVYPVVNDGKELTYVHYDGSEDETKESVWRQKYIDEKKKVAEFKKQLEQAKTVSEAGSSRSKSPILVANPSRKIPSCSVPSETAQQPMDIDTNKHMEIKQSDGGKILITLSKNSEEKINLEGHWPQVLPIVQQVMSIFYKPEGVVKENTKAPETEQNVKNKEDISGLTTPIIPVVDLPTRKVEELEREIFKEIEERDQEETTQDSTNVTKRKSVRARKTPSTSSEQSEKSAKRPRKSKPNEQTENPEDKAQTDDQTKMMEPNELVSTSDQAGKPSMTLSIADTLSVESITDKNTTEAAKHKSKQAKDKVGLTKDKTKQAMDKVEPTKDTTKQAKDKVEPTKDKTKQAKNKVEPTKNKTKQAKDKVERTKDQLVQAEKNMASDKDTDNELVEPIKNKTKQAKDKVERTKDQLVQAEKNIASDKDTDNELVEPIKNKTKQAKEKVERTKDQLVQAKKNMASDKDTDNALVKTIIIGTIEPPVTRSRKSGNDTDSTTRSITTRLSTKPEEIMNEENILYMFPPRRNTRKSIRKNTPTLSKSSENSHEISQDSRSINSIDSTQGYQDSDASPAKVNATRRKRKVSLIVRKGKHNTRRRSCHSVTHDMSLDSSNSSYFVPSKSKSQSTIDSAVYKTESYQILMENNKQPMKKLEVIDETTPDAGVHSEHFSSKEHSDYNLVIEIGSSSNVSLPLSPELSLVENLSISREMITHADHPTINEMQANDSIVSNIYNQYLITDVDVSIPLMQQDCELVDTQNKGTAKGNVKRLKAPAKSPIKVSELLSKVCTVNMSVNNTLSDSLDRKLRDLLLESAKKISDTNKENLMEVDEEKGEPKKKGKKRCSTPRKKSTKNTKAIVAPVIDEHIESCSHGGRTSCPPVINFIPLDENANNSADVQLNATEKPPKVKVKKNIIKVKIQRPENTKLKRSKECLSSVANTSQLSVYTDSGINETASISGLQSTDSVELIHNHSETCLQAHECFGDSLEFVENSKSASVISLNSTASLESELLKVMEDVEKLSGDYRNRTSQDWPEKSLEEMFGTPTDTVYHSPVGLASNCSLITEDLSDEASLPPTKWYLLSEDDTNTTNTNMRPEQMTSNIRVSNFSASLKQLFPIACAVPDLSTISEMSKENEDSRKGLDTDGDTRSSNY